MRTLTDDQPPRRPIILPPPPPSSLSLHVDVRRLCESLSEACNGFIVWSLIVVPVAMVVYNIDRVVSALTVWTR